MGLDPLPQVHGPKLDPFPLKTRKTKGSQLSFGKSSTVQNEVEIVNVTIDGKKYRLDLFKQDRAGQDRFYNECRAFGKLKELGEEGVAIKCFGYVQNDDGRMGIVKEFVAEPGSISKASKAQTIIKNLARLHFLGVVGIDTSKHGMAGGKFSNFSRALTISAAIEPNSKMESGLMTLVNNDWDAITTWVGSEAKTLDASRSKHCKRSNRIAGPKGIYAPRKVGSFDPKAKVKAREKPWLVLPWSKTQLRWSYEHDQINLRVDEELLADDPERVTRPGAGKSTPTTPTNGSKSRKSAKSAKRSRASTAPPESSTVDSPSVPESRVTR